VTKLFKISWYREDLSTYSLSYRDWFHVLITVLPLSYGIRGDQENLGDPETLSAFPKQRTDAYSLFRSREDIKGRFSECEP